MRANNERLNTARAVGNQGCDYLTTGTLAFSSSIYATDGQGWYGFVVDTAATVTAVTFKDRSGNTLTGSPTWLNNSLSAGVFIPAGFLGGQDAYISSITLSGGAIILYAD